MKSNKPIEDVTVGILVPCYKRPEYTVQTLKALKNAQEYENVYFYLVDDGSKDGTEDMLHAIELPNKTVIVNNNNMGLRNTVLKFFKWAREKNLDIIGVVGNDALMPKDWLTTMRRSLLTTDLDVASLNYMPSNPAFTQGFEDKENKGYRVAHDIVGLWFMDRKLTDGVEFDDAQLYGIKGSIAIMQQIKAEQDPKIGWITEIQALDIGHWSGEAPGHIKSEAHREYYDEVHRGISW